MSAGCFSFQHLFLIISSLVSSTAGPLLHLEVVWGPHHGVGLRIDWLEHCLGRLTRGVIWGRLLNFREPVFSSVKWG